MPARLPLRAAASRRAATEPYVCASCLVGSTIATGAATFRPARLRHTSARAKHIAPTRSSLSPRRRLTAHDATTNCNTSNRRFIAHGSLASATAINAPSTVPSDYRDLHAQLQILQDKASGYVDLSRLQLALRSLESDTPTIRVALLGLGSNGALAARKLARVLLSDPLADEENWEKELLETSGDGRSLLLRFGDAEDAVQHDPTIQTVHIPSPFLRRNNVEILVTTLNANGKSASQAEHYELQDAILVPPLTIPTSAGGRVGFVRYPVHMALIVAEGIIGAIEYGGFPDAVINGSLINSALSIPLQSSTRTKSPEQTATGNAVDIDLATHALKIFRASKANGAQFSNEWQTSRVSAISEWIASHSNTTEGNFNAAVKDMVDNVLSRTSRSIDRAESEEASSVAQASVQDSKRTETLTAISRWSADAHRDLQVNLYTSFLSPTWRRTVWWRLLWRIDDVSLSASDILRLSWLNEAEQSVAYLSGRISEAGLATPNELKEVGIVEPLLNEDMKAGMERYEDQKAKIETVAELLQTPTLLSRVHQQSGVNPLFDPPWPQTIHLSRQQMLHRLVPAFHAKAQALLLGTLSTIGGTTALSIWLYIATSGVALYEAGAITSLGVVWSLRRLQKLWSDERDGFESTVKEDGRRVLAEVEGHLEKIAKEGGRAEIRPEDAQNWLDARSAVERCREALANIRL
ncbi:Hypothetical protein R9X50_00672600 [Acrodontium crateriforme]|uniref:Mmc1 C-terminal domain-containing protein n=1 Tax=Acrodontium crateriforme TaxID=150365 RepID=A0AAQ3MAL6_9PEZI|nr:Hypothetical protein R9X50_00672600 [Acrodontium crateriforme]